MGQPLPAVIDNGSGVYFWDGLDAALGTEWVFLGVYRCEACGRSVTIVRFQRDEADRLFVRHKQCPGGCDAEHAWLASARG